MTVGSPAAFRIETEAAWGLSGWRALAGLSLCGFTTYGVGIYAFTQFLVPLSGEMGWGRGMLGGLMSAFWLAAPVALASAYGLGRLGLRRVVLCGALVEAGALMLMTLVHAAPLFLLCRFLMGVGKVMALTPIPIMTAKWFRRRSVVAFSVAIAAWHLGGLVLAPTAAWLIVHQGWRPAAIILAASVLVGDVVAVWLMREPESCTAAAALALARPCVSRQVTPGARVYVPIAVGTFAFYAGYSALLAQLSPMLADAGYDTAQIGAAMGTVSVFALIGCLTMGYVASVTRSNVAGAGVLLAIASVAVIATLLHDGGGLVTVYALVGGAGFMIGGGDPIIVEALRRATPASSYANAYSWWYLICLASVSASSLFAGVTYDWLHSYRIAFLAIAGLAGAAALIWWRFVRPDCEDGA